MGIEKFVMGTTGPMSASLMDSINQMIAFAGVHGASEDAIDYAFKCMPPAGTTMLAYEHLRLLAQRHAEQLTTASVDETAAAARAEAAREDADAFRDRMEQIKTNIAELRAQALPGETPLDALRRLRASDATSERTAA